MEEACFTPAYIDGPGRTVEARFEAIGFVVHVWGAHGRNDRFYTGRPVDARAEGRAFGPDTRRRLQRAALRGFLSGAPHRLYVDRDGDVVAELIGAGQ